MALCEGEQLDDLPLHPEGTNSTRNRSILTPGYRSSSDMLTTGLYVKSPAVLQLDVGSTATNAGDESLHRGIPTTGPTPQNATQRPRAVGGIP